MDYVFEQAGRQVRLYENGLFSDSFPEEEKRRLLAEQPELLRDWDPVCGDRRIRLCFIGRGMDRTAIETGLDACLREWKR